MYVLLQHTINNTTIVIARSPDLSGQRSNLKSMDEIATATFCGLAMTTCHLYSRQTYEMRYYFKITQPDEIVFLLYRFSASLQERLRKADAQIVFLHQEQ